MDRNQQALASGFRKAKGKKGAVVRLGIKPEMTVKQVEKLVIKLAKAKAVEEGVKYSTLLDGQQWYVENLLAFSKLDSQEQLNHEYDSAFSNVASEAEMLTALDAVS